MDSLLRKEDEGRNLWGSDDWPRPQWQKGLLILPIRILQDEGIAHTNNILGFPEERIRLVWLEHRKPWRHGVKEVHVCKKY